MGWVVDAYSSDGDGAEGRPVCRQIDRPAKAPGWRAVDWRRTVLRHSTIRFRFSQASPDRISAAQAKVVAGGSSPEAAMRSGRHDLRPRARRSVVLFALTSRTSSRQPNARA